MNTNNTNQIIAPVKSPTLASVLAAKLVGHVQNHKFSELFWQLSELILGLFFGALLVAPTQILSSIEYVLKIESYAVPKLVGFTILFFGRKTIFRTLKRIGRFFEKRKAVINDEKMIDNIPVPELVDYMLRNKHFKREGVNGVRATFGLNMDKFNRLAKKLEENKVLVRGENNGRILDGKWSRQALIDYLSGEKHSTNLQPRFTIHRIGAGHKVRLMREELASV